MRRKVAFKHVPIHALAVADQVLAGASNAVLVLSLSLIAAPDWFGYFSVLFAAYSLLLATYRFALSTPISLAANDGPVLRLETAAAWSCAAVTSTVLICAAVLVCLLVPGNDPEVLISLAIGGAAGLVQDPFRHALVAQRNAIRPTISDGTWFAVAALGGLVGVRLESEIVVSGSWALGAALSVLVVAWKSGVQSDGLLGLSHLRRTLKVRAHLAGGAAITGLSVLIGIGLVARLAGPSVAGAISAAAQVMTPISMLASLISLSVVSEAVHRSGRQQVVTHLRRSALATLVVGSVWTILATIVLRRLHLGGVWLETTPIIPVVGVSTTLSVVGASAALVLTGQSRVRTLSGLRAAQALSRTLVVPWLAAAIGTALAISVGELALTAGFAIIAWTAALRRRQH